MNINEIHSAQTLGLQGLDNPETLEKVVAKNKEGKTLLGDTSVRVITPADINQLVETLKAETEDQRRDLSRSRLANALTVIMSSTTLDGKDKELVKELNEKMDEIKELQQTDWDKLIDERQTKLGGLQEDLILLQIKTKEIEAAIERIKKTPEEQRTEQEKAKLKELENQKSANEKAIQDKGDEIAAAEKELDEAKAGKDRLSQLNGEIMSIIGQVSDGIRGALAEALKLGLDDNELKIEPKDKPKDPNAKDAEDQLADLLGGAKLADVIAGKRPIQA